MVTIEIGDYNYHLNDNLGTATIIGTTLVLK